MAYQHKCGFQKRLEKQQKDDKEKINRRTLFDVGVKLLNTSMHDSQKGGDKANNVGDNSTDASVNVMDGSKNENIPRQSDAEEEANSSERANIPPEISTANGKDSAANSNKSFDGEASENFHKETNDIRDGQKSFEEGLNNSKSGELDLSLLSIYPTTSEIKLAIKTPLPKLDNQTLPKKFPMHIFKKTLPNGEIERRDWLIWNSSSASIFCFPCRLFSRLPSAQCSALASKSGWQPAPFAKTEWKKLYDRVPEHEKSSNHKNCYLEWRKAEHALHSGGDLDNMYAKEIMIETEKWQQILKRILDVILTLSERALPFLGNNEKIGDVGNGNFLGVVELLARWDSVLGEHVNKVKISQERSERLQAHYLSHATQNEFILLLGNKVVTTILSERETAKYYSIIVDGTPDSSHSEQVTFILRYVLKENRSYCIKERFLCFTKFEEKTGEAIASLVLNILAKNNIPLIHCRGQSYDNGANMAGIYQGVQARILKQNSLGRTLLLLLLLFIYC